MELSSSILSDIIVHMKYARYLDDKKRRETWEEICERNMNMHIKKFPELAREITDLYEDFVLPKKVLPSMRSLQFAGKPIEINPARQYNCTFVILDCIEAFAETMFLLLGGSGVGFSVQKNHIRKLPPIRGQIKARGNLRPKRYLVADNIEGWADSVKILMESYFYGKKEISFDFSDIRNKGTRLVTAGGKAPGPAPLMVCLAQIQTVLENAVQERGMGTQLKPIEAHDIVCYIADAVLSGGIRRSSCISLFSKDDEEMLYCKSGAWWDKNPQRARANNSALHVRGMMKKRDFFQFWEVVKNSGSGEPGMSLTRDPESGTNPCHEISLKNAGACNLTEINAADITTQEELNARTRAAAILGTIQASYTNFHYLRDIWRETIESESLLGVSMTGTATGGVLHLDLTEAAKIAVETNREWASKLGINPAKRITTGKPSGTTSLVLGCSSGVHAWHAPYYIRRVRVNKDEAIYSYIKSKMPELVEDEKFSPHTTAVFSFPQKAPPGAIYRNEETSIDLLERVKKIHTEWISPGHIDGPNTHNQSVTVSVKENEWDEVGNWMWENRDSYTGISVLPYDGGTYVQPPFEECTKEKYDELIQYLTNVDLTEVIEDYDNTDLSAELACAGGACEIK